MGLKLITPSDYEPVPLLEMKDHLRIDTTDDDVLILLLMKAAREYCERYQNRIYLMQTWEFTLDEWPANGIIRIPKSPLQTSGMSIKYYGTDGTEYTWDASKYQIDTHREPGRVAPVYGETWPSTILRPLNGIIITFVAGYANVDAIPQRVKQAIKVLVGHLYEHREATDLKELKEVPFAVHALLGLDRIWLT